MYKYSSETNADIHKVHSVHRGGAYWSCHAYAILYPRPSCSNSRWKQTTDSDIHKTEDVITKQKKQLTSLPLTLDIDPVKLRSDPDTEDVSEASSSESKRGRRVGMAPAPSRVNMSEKERRG